MPFSEGYCPEDFCPICKKMLILQRDKLVCPDTDCSYIPTTNSIRQQKLKESVFCPKCKFLMVPSGGRRKCFKCGYITSNGIIAIPKKNEKITKKEIPEIKSSGEKVKCPSCGSFQYLCRGRHLIPNADFEAIIPGFLIHCQSCGYEWYYRYI